MKTLIIGIDVATAHSKVGLALAFYEDRDRVTLLKVRQCGKGSSPTDTITDWIKGHDGRFLLAMDAPLGWPKRLGKELSKHLAGNPLSTSPQKLFRRKTDRFIKQKIGKTPLDVGADRIARTAYAALALLGDLRKSLEKDIPLAWSPDFTDIAAIEVYPAATLKALGIRSSGYKDNDQEAERREILSGLSGMVDIKGYGPDLVKNPDALDAVVCVVAGMDFIADRVMQPEDEAIAIREGWIWARPNKKIDSENPGMATKLDPKELVNFKELLMANSIQVDAAVQLLIEKGFFSEQEFYAKLKQVQAQYQEKRHD